MNGSSHQEEAPFHVYLEFENLREARELAVELAMWTPMGGHSENALRLFDLLRNNESKR